MADFVKDPRMQKLLDQLISRPETISSMDVEEEDMVDAEAMQVEEPQKEYQAPADMKESVGQLSASTDKMIQGLPGKSYQADSDITKMVRKLKAGQPMEEEIEVQGEDLEDPSMDSDLRKAALQKIKQKYLGR